MPKGRKRARRNSRQRKDVTEGLPPLNLNAAGIDVGSAEHYVAVPPGRVPHPVQKFGSFTADLHRLAQWLKGCGVDTVAMQATGVYWVGLYEILEEHGLDVKVVNARYTKTLPGRKSDVQECQWLQKLHTFGLLHNSFLPGPEIRGLRTYLAATRESGHGGRHLHSAPAKDADGDECAIGQRTQRSEWSHGPGDCAGHREG